MTTFGIEEEYLLLDPQTAFPVPRANEVQKLLEGSAELTAGDIQRELLNCQLETATPVCRTLSEAEESLLRFRRQLDAAARKSGVRAAGTASAPRIGQDYPELTDNRRYHQLKASAPGVVGDQFINGQHVHVSVPDRESGVQALNRIRPWLPVVVALSANSPLWLGRDSGFASWRTVHYRRWPMHGCAPVFRDADDYEHRVQRLVDLGVILDRGVITWLARLSDRYPTLEVRAGDMQLEARDAVVLAGMIRGLVSTAVAEALADTPYVHPAPELLDAALWQAGRSGLQGGLVDPVSGVLLPARDLVAAFVLHIRPALVEAHDADRVDAGLATLWDRGTGAERQRRALASGGIPALLDLYATSLTADG